MFQEATGAQLSAGQEAGSEAAIHAIHANPSDTDTAILWMQLMHSIL